MKTIVMAEREFFRILSSKRFRVSILVANLFVVLSVNPVIAKAWKSPDYLIMNFSYTIPFLGFATLFACVDVVSRERENGTINLLFTQPIPVHNIALGKFIGAVCAAGILSLVNVVTIYVIHILLYGSTIGVDKVLLVLSTYMLFCYAVVGFTIFFSTIIKHSMPVFVLAAVFYFFLVESYAFGTLANMKFLDLGPLIVVLFVGMWVVWPANLAYEPNSILRYMAPNVDAHRIAFSYFSPNIIPAQEIGLSIVALLAIGTAGSALSILLLRRVSRR